MLRPRELAASHRPSLEPTAMRMRACARPRWRLAWCSVGRAQYEKILKAELRCPTYLQNDVKGLIQGLLVRDPLRRLGSGPGDVKELERSAYFAALSFDKVFNKEYTPIYKPNVVGETDVANFDPQFTAEAAVDSVIDNSALAGQPNQFEGFTYEDRPQHLR